ncbi:MAG: DegT/DnrJ/EryC1/StrS family aminotransferase [Bacteroidota bacterium]
MNIPFVDLKAQYESIKEDIDHAIASVLSQSRFVGGEIVKEFETSFAQYLEVDSCVGVANGTDALEIALQSLGIGQGDEVIVPALSWVSTALAVNNVGAEPVFVDVIEREKTIDPVLIEEKITPRTKAIIPVHLYGLPARMGELMAMAGKHELKVIEDCAQAHGAEVDGKKVGHFGVLATFSFYPSKNLGAYGDAGAIVTNNVELGSAVRRLSNLGQTEKHDHRILGKNSRLDTLQAAILKAKLPHLDKWINGRIQVSQWYDKFLKVGVKPMVPDHMKHVFHLYVVQHLHRGKLIEALDSANIGHSIHYPKPLPFLDCYAYKGHLKGQFPVAEKLCKEVISIPMFAELKEDQVKEVCSIINKV